MAREVISIPKDQFIRFQTEDPLRDLPPSLLSAAHIEFYVRATGMLDTFDTSALKSASYEVRLRGKATWWDENGKKFVTDIDDNTETLKLEPNSITFVQVEPYFCLPKYIAIRFNLRIHHVHRGLLLGTGPLVDPGFEGRLLIPLHNLTATPYEMDLRDALIWIEFTKTSFNLLPDDNYKERDFPEKGKNLSPEDYLRKANMGLPIQSSIPDAHRKALKRSDKAQKAAEKSSATLKRIQTFGFIALLSAVGGIAAIVYSSLTLVRGLSDGQIANATRLGVLEGKTQSPKSADLEPVATAAEVKALRQRIDDLERRFLPAEPSVKDTKPNIAPSTARKPRRRSAKSRP